MLTDAYRNWLAAQNLSDDININSEIGMELGELFSKLFESGNAAVVAEVNTCANKAYCFIESTDRE